MSSFVWKLTQSEVPFEPLKTATLFGAKKQEDESTNLYYLIFTDGQCIPICSVDGTLISASN